MFREDMWRDEKRIKYIPEGSDKGVLLALDV
jgi:hypothetical protein